MSNYFKAKLEKEIKEIDNHFKKQCGIKDSKQYSVDLYFNDKNKYDNFAKKTKNLENYQLKRKELTKIENQI